MNPGNKVGGVYAAAAVATLLLLAGCSTVKLDASVDPAWPDGVVGSVDRDKGKPGDCPVPFSPLKVTPPPFSAIPIELLT